MITSSSRYTTATADKDGESIVIAVRKPTSVVEYVTYTSREGDTFALLATRLYNDPGQYWRIADINPQVKFADTIPTGEVLRIPR